MRHRWFVAVLVIGLAIRVMLLWLTRGLGTEIVDEQHYVQLARNVMAGNGFGWGPGALTSMRPPLYPTLLTAVFTVAGADNLIAVRALQIALALITTLLVYHLARIAFGVSVARLAAATFWLYPTLLLFNLTILTETLFTCLMVLFLLLAVMLVRRPGPWIAIGCGAALAAAALTRSAVWPLPLVLCPLLALLIQAPIRTRLALAALVLAGYVIVVGPWAIRNTRLQQSFTVVDTMGGFNLRMGNYEHTPEDRMWDAVGLTGEQNWSYALTVEQPGHKLTDGQKEKWAQRKAIEYMLAHPGTTLRRAMIKFADLWGLEREFVAGLRKGMYGAPPVVSVAISAFIVVFYVAVAILGGAGMWLAAPERRTHLLLLLPIVAITAVHTIVFGHSRYHLPLMPILAIYASALLVTRRTALRSAHRFQIVGAIVTIIALGSVWVRQILFVDGNRLQEWLSRVG